MPTDHDQGARIRIAWFGEYLTGQRTVVLISVCCVDRNPDFRRKGFERLNGADTVLGDRGRDEKLGNAERGGNEVCKLGRPRVTFLREVRIHWIPGLLSVAHQ